MLYFPRALQMLKAPCSFATALVAILPDHIFLATCAQLSNVAARSDARQFVDLLFAFAAPSHIALAKLSCFLLRELSSRKRSRDGGRGGLKHEKFR